MKRAIGLVGLSLALLLAGALIPQAFHRTEAQTPPTGAHDVILVRCEADTKDFAVRAYEGSAAAPAKRSKSCPETLSLLKKDAFWIESVGYFDDDDDFIVYTLVR